MIIHDRFIGGCLLWLTLVAPVLAQEAVPSFDDNPWGLSKEAKAIYKAAQRHYWNEMSARLKEHAWDNYRNARKQSRLLDYGWHCEGEKTVFADDGIISPFMLSRSGQTAWKEMEITIGQKAREQVRNVDAARKSDLQDIKNLGLIERN